MQEDLPSIVVYLSGQLESNWQDTVITQVPGLRYIDPRTHNLELPSQYSLWDLFGIQQADIILGYMEEDNPSGYGLATEIAYAKGLGNMVVLADQRLLAISEMGHFLNRTLWA